MRARLIHKNDLLNVVDVLRKEYEVYAPFYGRDRDTYFEKVTDANRDNVQIHLPNPYYPPKRYVFPHIQHLFTIHTGEHPTIEPVKGVKKQAVFGIRSCDVAGIFHLDRFYLGNAFKDNYYEEFRNNTFLVNVVCSDAKVDVDDDCFCVCADTGPAARENFDLQLMDMHNDRGEFLAVAGTPRGEALFALPFFTKAKPEHVIRRREILNEVRKRFKIATSWYSAATRFITQGGITEDTWKKVGDRCLECGGCSYVCPTCTCFTVTDRITGPNETERVRIWDACALSGFTRMAGGHNPRQTVHDRRNRRFFRKLGYYFIQRELMPSCVGCGRCVSVCHGDIGMPHVVEILRRETAATERK
jgi:sulfhydrogenase subunit beta (sulfur reductase)